MNDEHRREVREELSASWGSAYAAMIGQAAGVAYRKGRRNEYTRGLLDAAGYVLVANGFSAVEAAKQVIADCQRFREACAADDKEGDRVLLP